MFSNREYVLAVYKYKSFSNAAKKLYISQPSLSASIKRIETEIGAPLFDRSTNPLSLTEIGERYVSLANEIESIEQNFKTFVADSMHVVSGLVKIGGGSLSTSFVLPSLVSEFKKEHPKIDFEIIEDSTQNLIDMLLNGRLDLVIDNVNVSNKSLTQHILMPEVFILAVPSHLPIKSELKEYSLTAEDIRNGVHKRENAPAVSLTKFKNEGFILLKSENDTGKRAKKLFKKHDISPNVIFKLDQQMTAYNMASSGIGLTFISDTLVTNNNYSPDILYYKLDDPEITRNIYIYTKANRYLSKACTSFMENAIG